MNGRYERYEEAMREGGIGGALSASLAANAAMKAADAETKRKHDAARECMGPKDQPGEAEGPKMFAAGWYAALEFLERHS